MTTNGNNNDQNHADDFADTDAMLRELGIELDDTGSPASVGSGTDDEERQKQTRHAFAVLKRKAKEEREGRLAAEAKAEEALKNKVESKTGVAQLPTSGSATQASQLMQQLKLRAMGELGLTAITTTDELELVNAHAGVIYQRLVNEQAAVSKAQSTAIKFVENEVAKYNLDDVDAVEVKKRITALPPLDQVNGDKVKETVARFLGEKLLDGGTVSPASQRGSDQDDGGTNASDARAASHQVLTRTGSGVRLGKSTSTPTVKPATPAELAEMKRVGLSDVKMYREAKSRSQNYIQ